MAAPAPPPVDHPPGYLRQYDGDGLRDTCIAFIVLVVFIVILRFYARTKTKAKPSAADYWILPAAATFISLCALAVVGMSLSKRHNKWKDD